MSFFSKLSQVLLSGTANLLFYQVTTMLMPWLLIVYYSQYSTLKDVGEFSYYLSIVAPLVILFSLPPRNLMLKGQSYDFLGYFNVRVVLYGLSILFGGAIIYFININNPKLLIGVLIFKIIEQLFDIPLANQVIKKKWSELFCLSSTRVLTVLFTFALVICFLDKSFIILSINTSLGLVCLVFIFIATRKVEKVKALDKRKVLFDGVPLAVAAFITSIQINIPKYTIGADDLNLLALYTILSYASLLMIVLSNAISQVKLKEVNDFILTRELPRVYKIIYQNLLIIIGLTTLLAIVFLSPLGGVFLNMFNIDASVEYKKLLLISIFIAVPQVLQSCVNYLLIAAGEYNKIVYLSIFSSILTFLLCELLYTSFSLYGAYAALAIVGVLYTAIAWCIFVKKVNTNNV